MNGATSTTFTRCGFLDATAKTVVVYSANSKFKVKDITLGEDLEFVGVLSGVKDCVVTNNTWVDPTMKKTDVDKAIIAIGVKNNCLTKFVASRNAYEAVTSPSECIEMIMKNTTCKFKYNYTFWILRDPISVCDQATDAKMMAFAKLCNVPISTVGLKLRVKRPQEENEEVEMVVHNPSGVTGFNPFNSSPLYFEAHTEMDVLMMMAAFLKHNGLWGEITANMDLFKFDYAGAFFDHRWGEGADETSFMIARAQLLSAYFKCTSLIKNVSHTRKRKIDPENTHIFPNADVFEANTEQLYEQALRGSSAVVGGGHGCPHSPDKHHVFLDGSAVHPSCLACFSTLFFVPRDVNFNFVNVKNLEGVQQWIDERVSLGDKTLERAEGVTQQNLKDLFLMLADLTQAAHDSVPPSVPLGPCGRRWNWPSKTSHVLQEFIMYTLASSLKKAREPSLPEMNMDMLYCLLNPFGKMLLLFMHNTFVMTSERNPHTPSPGGMAIGKWWDVNYAGPNLWSFQITKCTVEKGKTIQDLACLETLHRLPWPGQKVVDDRVVFKGFCRGENLSGPGELISDITQSVKTMALLVENRDFSIDEKTNSINTTPGVGNVLCSLEVTGYRPNRAQESKNSGRVSARVMRILESREGARVWRMPKHDALILERVNHDVVVSTEAMERAITSHKILYYDIETNTVNFTDESAVITSICCCLCTGGNISRGGERSIFGLAAPETDPKQLERMIRKTYPGGSERDKYVVTDHAPDIICIFTNEFEMLMAFAEYVRDRKPHVVSGWNSRAFDDPFVFTRIVKHLSAPQLFSVVANRDTVKSVLPNGGRNTTREERLTLATTGLFNLEQFMDKATGFLNPSVSSDFLAGAASQANAKFHEQNKSFSKAGSAGWYQNIIGGCCTAIRLDLMRVCAKAYKESLSEFNLNAVLAKVSTVADRFKNVKDEVDLQYHLLGFLKLKNVKDQATVHVYCCKDAYLTAVVSTSINKEGEIFRLCLDSALTEAVVTANLITPLCIGEGAICRNMGSDRADRRGVGIRRHSIATDTKGGMVSQPIVNFVPYQTIDMTSLYPMAMIQNNLCTSTFVTHRQVIDLRDRMVEKELNKKKDRSLLSILDECNMRVLDYYRPNDIAVTSWRNSNTNKVAPVTRLEKRIGKRFVKRDDKKEEENNNDWCLNAPPNMVITAAGLDYFPEVVCDIDIQQTAKVNDDMHIAPSSCEYLLQVLPLMIISQPHIGAHITAGDCQTVEEFLLALESEFNKEKDASIIDTHWTFAGCNQFDFSHSPVTDKIEHIIKMTGREASLLDKTERIRTLLDRIYRRVSVYDSADDIGVRLWTSRLINVGMLARTWNIKNDTLQGVIPTMQKKYRADRVVMQNNVKKYAISDPKRADLNKVGQLTTKLAMNAMYGCFALKANMKSSKREFKVGVTTSAANIANAAETGGVGGGTRHSVCANQITETARCVFGNIGCALQQALPATKQVYGDTDSVFCVHNIPGDGGVLFEKPNNRMVYVIDLILKYKMANIIPILVNCTTKGIRHVQRRDAGHGVMNIAHERLAILGLLFAKKTYHMLHFNENSAGFEAMLSACKTTGESCGMCHIDKFVTLTHRPAYADGYVVPHNSSLIFRVANQKGGEKLKNFLDAEGVKDARSLARWFTSSPVWIELDAKVINNLYASKIADAENGHWIDAVTSRPLDGNDREAVSQANTVFTSYKKGAFVKKGISASTKLKGLQSLFARLVPAHMNPKEKYFEAVSNHIRNFASHTTNPSMMITSVRVNKLDSNAMGQNRPNPLALAINNHLNPSMEIFLGEKFKTVTSVSAWSLVTDSSEIPAGYYNSGGVRWNPENMKGSIPCFSVKSLSVIPNAVSTAYDMLDGDKKALSSMVKKNADVLCSASAVSGFSLRKGALSFNTGVIVTNDLAMACIRTVENIIKGQKFFVGGKQQVEYDNDDDEEEEKDEEPDATSFLLEMKNDISSSILSRLVKSSCSACGNITQRKKVLENAAEKKLADYIIDVMELDQRVADQMDALIHQLESVKEVCQKKRFPGGIYKSQLDDMVSKVKVNFGDVLKEAAAKTRLHWTKCPVTVPEGKGSEQEGVPFRVALETISGKHKCTNTCDFASCLSLYFVLLTTLALNLENDRRRMNVSMNSKFFETLIAKRVFEGDVDAAKMAMERIKTARRLNTVKTCFPNIYNWDSDCLVYLFEPCRIPNLTTTSMTVEDLRRAIASLSESKSTGKIWNYSDERFFGKLMDKRSTCENEARCCVEQKLPFMTGLYHVAAVEIAAACLSIML